MSRLLTSEEIERQLRDLAGWSLDGHSLRASYAAPDFRSAVQLIVDVAEDAEQMDHHPDVDLRFCMTSWRLFTHVRGGVTQLDVELAHRVAQAAARLHAEVAAL